MFKVEEVEPELKTETGTEKETIYRDIGICVDVPYSHICWGDRVGLRTLFTKKGKHLKTEKCLMRKSINIL